MAGALHGSDDLVIEGTVEGPVHGDAGVTVAQGAVVKGPVRGRDLVLAGRLDFDLFGSNSVRLAATAELMGNIEAPKVAIDEGAVFEGQVKMKRTAAAAAPKEQRPREIPSLPEIGKRKLTRRDA